MIETGEQLNKVEFFNKDDLDEFLFKRKKRDKGILQKFTTPKGPYNCMLILVIKL
jgi:hypothetical protein